MSALHELPEEEKETGAPMVEVRGLVKRLGETELDAGPVTLMLTPEAMVPTRPARGVIVHFHVDDLNRALERARSRGAAVLLEPTHTDWGWGSAMIQGPEDIVVDFYRPLDQPAGTGDQS